MIELKNIIENAKKDLTVREGYRVVVGMSTCGLSAGAKEVYDTIKTEVEAKGLKNVRVVPTGCIGMCIYEPIVEVFGPGMNKISYIHVDPEKAIKIVTQHLQEGKPVEEYMVVDDDGKRIESLNDIYFYKKQKRVVLQNCGFINPEDIREYIAMDGYKAEYEVLKEMTPEAVINVITASGLRGRGGAGFPTGRKWSFAHSYQSDQKYFICNADEGDPGAFMDRSLLEGDPHSVLEAMVIGGYAIGATKGFIYVRAEYPIAVQRLGIAIDQARELGFLGKDIFGSGFDFDIEIRLGAGAFVCGEETALIASVEGKRGMPRNKPPFPAEKGLWGKPTCINNVETLSNIPQIILKGADWFRSFGTKGSPGTKVFALGGKITHTGLVEVPMGITLRDIIYDIGGGCANGKAFKAVQTGGPSGGCITMENFDTPMDFDTLKAIGSMMGSGGMIVMDEDTCMVDIARFYMDFIVDESCGQCVPCREGTKRMLEILNRIVNGNGTMEDLTDLQELGEHLQLTALCALGQTAPNPVLSTIYHFRDEYEAHIKEKKCPAGVCSALLDYYITDACTGCTRCVRQCPVHAITGKVKERHVIDTAKCIKCGNCMNVCSFKAIVRK